MLSNYLHQYIIPEVAFGQHLVDDMSIELSYSPCASSGSVMLQYSGFHQLIMEYRAQDCIHYSTVVNADKKNLNTERSSPIHFRNLSTL